MDSRKECVSVPGMMAWQKRVRTLTVGLLVLLLTFSPLTTPSSLAARKGRGSAPEATQASSKAAGKLAETAPPELLQELRQDLEKYQPQIKIVSPRSQEVLEDTTVTVKFQVKDLPIFKDKKLGLGPHLHVLLDNRPYQAVYDLDQPLVFDQLEPGTHTIRAFASRPWHESFKNEGAYAQTTFHVFAKTQENSPNPNLPLLTYSRPQGSYGAEPILLDFYLTNAPLHLVAREDKKDDVADWKIRCTVNGKSFLLDQWQPVYLKGFKPGQNWVQLEFLDENGKPVPNAFNNTARIITYEPTGQDTLAKLVRGEFAIDEVRGLADPNYVPPVPKPEPTPTPAPIESPVAKPIPVPAPTPSPAPTPALAPVPVPVAPVIKATPSPKPSLSPAPIVSPAPLPATKPAVKVPPVEETPTPAPATPKPVVPAPTSATQDLPKGQSEPQPEKSPDTPSGVPVRPIPQPEPVKSRSQPEAEQKSAKDTINEFLNRFRPAPRSSKSPIIEPAPVPAISPSPLPVKTPAATPAVTPKGVEGPKPTIAPKPEVTRTPVVTPNPSPTVAPLMPKTVAPEKTEVTPRAISTPKPVVKPTPTPSPFSTKPVSPEPVKPSVKPSASPIESAQKVTKPEPAKPAPVTRPIPSERPKVEGSKALSDIQEKATQKGEELKSEFTSQWNKLRDRFRRSPQSAVTKPTPQVIESEIPSPSGVSAEIKAPPLLTAPGAPEPVSAGIKN